MLDLLTPSAAARILGVVPATVRQMEKTGKLPVATRTSTGWRLFNAKDVERLRRQRARDAAQPARPTCA